VASRNSRRLHLLWLLVGVAAPVLLTACQTRPQLTYIGPGQAGDAAALFTGPAHPFRFARSLVRIEPPTVAAPEKTDDPKDGKPRAPGAKAAASAQPTKLPPELANFRKTVVDPVLAGDGEWRELPGQAAFERGKRRRILWYKVTLGEEEVPSLPASRLAEFSGSTLHALPLPSCRPLRLTLGVMGSEEEAGAVRDVIVGKVQATAVPTEQEPYDGQGVAPLAPMRYLRPADNLLSQTTLTEVSYITDTYLLAKVGTKVTNTTPVVIESVFGIATALAPFVLLGEQVWAVQEIDLKVADNRSVRSVPLPGNGTITLVGACTANSTDAGGPSRADSLKDLKQLITSTAELYKTVQQLEAEKKKEEERKAGGGGAVGGGTGGGAGSGAAGPGGAADGGSNG
jgi:hypothetical protein